MISVAGAGGRSGRIAKVPMNPSRPSVVSDWVRSSAILLRINVPVATTRPRTSAVSRTGVALSLERNVRSACGIVLVVSSTRRAYVRLCLDNARRSTFIGSREVQWFP